MVPGEVVTFDESKGYGFVRPDSGGDDVFVHVNDLLFDKHYLHVGMRIEFEIDEGNRGLKAYNIDLARGESAKPQGLAKTDSPSRRSTESVISDRVVQITEALLTRVPSLTAEQVVLVRQVALDVLDTGDAKA